MAMFSNALNLYRRVDTIEVDCGSFSVELRSYHTLFKELGDEQIRLRAEGILPKVEATPQPRKRLTSSAARMKGKETQVQQETSEYLLGSLERDQRFFAEKVMVNWSNLIDDDGNEVPFNADNAMALFASPGGMELYAELIATSLDIANFAGVRSVNDDVKNS
mgnify:CR=1 FL=1